MKILYKDLGYAINGCVFDVHNGLGTGYDEESYHIALVERLSEMGIPFQTKVSRYIEHRGINAYKYVADIIVADKIIVELKSQETDFTPLNFLQIFSYLKCWQKDLGLLVNFGQPSAFIKRVLYAEKEVSFYENYDAILDLISPPDKLWLRGLRESILAISRIHGLGYDENVYKSLLLAELNYNRIPYAFPTTIPVRYNGKIIKEYEMKYPLISDTIICGIAAVKEDISIDIAKVKTYLSALNLPYGLIAHFGKKKLEILGICQ